LLCRSTNHPKLKNHYKTHCRILSEVIKTAKKLYYNKLIINYNNKAKSIWNIVKMVTKKKVMMMDLHLILMGKHLKTIKA